MANLKRAALAYDVLAGGEMKDTNPVQVPACAELSNTRNVSRARITIVMRIECQHCFSGDLMTISP